ncbi:MAG: hypothetical protein JW934_16305, partial [Anaerolineae bacterium]|nr:hypothetical protein [Anaerolineae bacterium]
MSEHPLSTLHRLDPDLMAHVQATDPLIFADGALPREDNMIRLTEKGLIVESPTTAVEFEGARIVSIRDAVTGREFLDRGLAEDVPPFDLLHQNGKRSPLGVHPLASQTHSVLLTDHIAEIVLNDWECDVSLRVSVDLDNGDVLVEPSAWTMQGGVAGLALNVAGIRP